MKTFIDMIIDLRKSFQVTELKKWDFQKGACELIVQLGHLGIVLSEKHIFLEVREHNRRIESIPDELSDVLLQLVVLMLCVNFSKTEILDILNVNKKAFTSFPQEEYQKLVIFASQVVESSMQLHQTRFAKERDQIYICEENFIKNRLNKMLVSLMRLYTFYEVDFVQAFCHMKKETEVFLSTYDHFFQKNKNHFHALEDFLAVIENRIKRTFYDK